MKMPPFWMSLRIADQDGTKFRLWLPLCLLWLLALPFFLLALVVALLADLVTLPLGGRFRFIRLLFGVVEILAAARGTEIHVDPQDPTQARDTVAFTLR